MSGYVFIADDFTGASDTLATLAEAGIAARLCVEGPSLSRLPETPRGQGAFPAVGIATDFRACAPQAVEPRLRALMPMVRARQPRFVHYKICSTFDSAPHVGNVGAAVAVLEEELSPALTVILGGQPSLQRFCLFGTLFARAPDGAVHRIDRHPVMSRHPVTPMGEADLRRHLAAQGLGDLALLARPELAGAAAVLAAMAEGGGRRVLVDAVDDTDIEMLGLALSLLETHGRPLLLVGASGVAEAVAGKAAAAGSGASALGPVAGPRLALAGSRSAATAAQVAAASRYTRLPLGAKDIAGEGREACAARCAQMLAAGTNVLAHLDPEADYGLAPDALSESLAELAARILALHPVAALAVAGGDTSGAVVRRLGFDSLSFEARAGSGVAVCRGHAPGTLLEGMRLLLKGGQVGPLDLFDRFAA
ncbi:four-carbon acid sugar kinase family protein [Stappia sp. 28M-7]|uniref:four-carbon acid sugar kinase family protein n=1 Tax=Stappia sp. 28M-7 TaxID=2762596 RepID=UPI00163C9F17|nr:four-carbon acid sugar kinase family protein [Stappia sp. 28M-7]MBC2860833.1 four-carbon acid sugar kinase family protein [Stappia sp. 28M-7]